MQASCMHMSKQTPNRSPRTDFTANRLLLILILILILEGSRLECRADALEDASRSRSLSPLRGLCVWPSRRRRIAAYCVAFVHSEGLYVFLTSGLGLLDVGERLSAAQHPLLPQSALRTGPISRLYGALST